jgi:hypothetical protein
MKLITKRDIIKSIPGKWEEQYLYGLDFFDTDEDIENEELIYNEIMKLDIDTCSEKEINDIIGNDSWSSLECSECGKRVDTLVELVDNYESEYNICLDCLEKIRSLFLTDIRKRKLND